MINRRLLALTYKGIVPADLKVPVFDYVSPQCYTGLQETDESRRPDKR